jgi:hypothetical protein
MLRKMLELALHCQLANVIVAFVDFATKSAMELESVVLVYFVVMNLNFVAVGFVDWMIFHRREY